MKLLILVPLFALSNTVVLLNKDLSIRKVANHWVVNVEDSRTLNINIISFLPLTNVTHEKNRISFDNEIIVKTHSLWMFAIEILIVIGLCLFSIAIQFLMWNRF